MLHLPSFSLDPGRPASAAVVRAVLGAAALALAPPALADIFFYGDPSSGNCAIPSNCANTSIPQFIDIGDEYRPLDRALSNLTFGFNIQIDNYGYLWSAGTTRNAGFTNAGRIRNIKDSIAPNTARLAFTHGSNSGRLDNSPGSEIGINYVLDVAAGGRIFSETTGVQFTNESAAQISNRGNIRIAGATVNRGTIENLAISGLRGRVIAAYNADNAGQGALSPVYAFTVLNEGVIRNDSDWTNGLLEQANAGVRSATLLNRGRFDSAGAFTNYAWVDNDTGQFRFGAAPGSGDGFVANLGSFSNRTGTVEGGGGTFNNQRVGALVGDFVNETGGRVVMAGTFENRGLFTNQGSGVRPDGTTNGFFAFMRFENAGQGEALNSGYFENGGTFVNESAGSTGTFGFRNAGSFVAGSFSKVQNNFGGVFINAGSIGSPATVTNDGTIQNSGTWRNGSTTLGPGAEFVNGPAGRVELSFQQVSGGPSLFHNVANVTNSGLVFVGLPTPPSPTAPPGIGGLEQVRFENATGARFLNRSVATGPGNPQGFTATLGVGGNYFTPDASSTFVNDGTFENGLARNPAAAVPFRDRVDVSGRFENSGTFTNNDYVVLGGRFDVLAGTVTNDGLWDTRGGLIVRQAATGFVNRSQFTQRTNVSQNEGRFHNLAPIGVANPNYDPSFEVAGGRFENRFSGTFDNQSTMKIFAATGYSGVTPEFRNEGLLENAAAGSINVSSLLSNSLSGNVANSGRVVVATGGAATTAGSFLNLAGGQLVVEGTFANLQPSAFVNNGRVEVRSGGSFVETYGGASVRGNYRQESGETIVDGVMVQSQVINAGGVFSGSGTINGNVTSAATIAPGSSPGRLTIDGNLDAAGSIFDIEIAGRDAGISFDQLVVTGNTKVNGAFVNFRFLGDFLPTSGEVFNWLVVSGGTLGLETLTIRTFSDVGTVDGFLDSQGRFAVTAVAPVPLPPAAWLVGSGLVALAAMRRRRAAVVVSCVDGTSSRPWTGSRRLATAQPTSQWPLPGQGGLAAIRIRTSGSESSI